MSVKLAILKSGEHIISDIKEGYVEDRVVTYILDNPCEVVISPPTDNSTNKVNLALVPWPSLSSDHVVPIITDWVVAVVEPISNVKNMYIEEIVNGRKQAAKGSDLDRELSVGLSD